MTYLPPHNSIVTFRASAHDPLATGRVCGNQWGGREIGPRVEVETQDGDKIMVPMANVELA